VTLDKLQAEFARCRPWLEAACERSGGTVAIEDVIHAIGEGRMHFWPGEHCAAVTQVAVFPRVKFLNVVLAGGDLDEIVEHMEPAFRRVAAALGCKRVTCVGRAGWEKALKRRGWKKDAIVLSVAVEETSKGEQPI
jgi:hypothetical protein